MRTAKLWTFMIICVYIYCIPKDPIIGIQQNRSARDLCTCHSPIGGLCNALISMTVFFFLPATADNYKPSCCTIGISQSNLVRQMEGDVSNEEPILAPAAACLYRRRSFAQTLRFNDSISTFLLFHTNVCKLRFRAKAESVELQLRSCFDLLLKIWSEQSWWIPCLWSHWPCAQERKKWEMDGYAKGAPWFTLDAKFFGIQTHGNLFLKFKLGVADVGSNKNASTSQVCTGSASATSDRLRHSFKHDICRVRLFYREI